MLTLKITLTPTLIVTLMLIPTLTLILNVMLTLKLTQTLTLNLTPKLKLWKALKKVKKKKEEVAKVRVELKKAMAYQTWSITAMLRAASRLHDKLIFSFELRHATRPKCSTDGTIAPAHLLPRESWQLNGHYFLI